MKELVKNWNDAKAHSHFCLGALEMAVFPFQKAAGLIHGTITSAEPHGEGVLISFDMGNGKSRHLVIKDQV